MVYGVSETFQQQTIKFILNLKNLVSGLHEFNRKIISRKVKRHILVINALEN